MIKFNTATILIAPLDWGLGHATRCIPLIKTLKKNGYNVVVGVCEKQKILLQQEFDDIKFIDLAGYNIQYAKDRKLFALKISTQIPKILRSIKQEKKWLDTIIEKEKIDVVISDNRYGLHSKKVPCIFITHQLIIKAPFVWLENVLQKINYKFINRFSQCLVPDIADENSIAGLLSHPKKTPAIATHYIGLLSRFNKVFVEKKYDVCVLISGPEPQRTILENILLKQLLAIKNKKILLVRGLPEALKTLSLEEVEVVNHLQGKDLQQAICSSEIIIARSGYTTVMELLSLQKKAILIPTPGQTEQEYLAHHLHQQKMCLSYEQNEIIVAKAIDEAKKFEYNLANEFSFQEDFFLALVNDLLKQN